MGDGGMTPEKQLKLARYVLQGVEACVRPTFPTRPAMIALDDHELLDAYQSYSAGVKLQADKRRALSYFGTWRVSVWSAESVAARRLLSLVDAASVFADHELLDEMDALLTFAEENYPGFQRNEVPAKGEPWYVLRDWCQQVAKDYALLPEYLRTMREPKGGVPFHRPQGHRGPDGDPGYTEEPDEQGSLPWED
jgi:hypothetical protein